MSSTALQEQREDEGADTRGCLLAWLRWDRPREAAVEVMRLVNHRHTHVAMLALHVSLSLSLSRTPAQR